MIGDLQIRCDCGGFRAVVEGLSPERANRVICGCGSCQRYARHCGRAEAVLDEHGGTTVLNFSPARLRLLTGAENLSCLRMTPKGALRWRASCCGAPIANTLPVIGVPFISLLASSVAGADREETIARLAGPVRARVNSAGDAPMTGKARTAWMILRLARLTIGWRLAGDHLRSPFFDAKTGAPIRTPELAPKDAGREG